MAKLMKTKNLSGEFYRNNQQGMSLVSTLIALGILSLVVGFATIGVNNVFAARQRMAAIRSAMDVEESIVQNVSDAFKKYINLNCANSSSFYPSINFNPITLNASSLRSLTSVYGSDSNFTRCKNTPFVSGSPLNASRFYLCYKVDFANNTNYESESFAKNKGAFIEVLLNIRDLRTDTPVTCNTLVPGNMSGLGIEFYYSLHWITKINNTMVPKSHMGSGNVAL